MSCMKYTSEAEAEKSERVLKVGDTVRVNPQPHRKPDGWHTDMMKLIGQYGVVKYVDDFYPEDGDEDYLITVDFFGKEDWCYTRQQLEFVRTDRTDSIDVRVTLDNNGVWHTVGRKDDSGKPVVVKGCLQMFPEAIRLVSSQSEQGAEKYGSWDNWKNVESSRYLEALGRHLLENDIIAVAWNALAVLQLRSEGK